MRIFEWLRKKKIEKITRIDDDFGKDLSEKQKEKMRQIYDELDINFDEFVYGIEMANIALKLVVKYGNLIEVRCLQGPVPNRIELIYEDGHKFVVTERSGYLDITLISFGYYGTGPDCFCAFLKASGFDISRYEIAVIRPPFILRKSAGKIRAEGDTKRFVERLLPGGERLLHWGEIEERKAVAEILDKLGWKPSSEIEKVYYLIAKGELDELAKIGGSVVKPLIQALKDDNPTVRKRAAEVLGKIGDARAVEPLIQALKDEYSYVRQEVVEALVKLGWKPRSDTENAWHLMAICEWTKLVELGELAVDPLVQALKMDVGWKAVEALVKIGEPAVDSLIQALKDEIWFVRERAAAALGEIGDARAVGPLSEALKNEKDSPSFRKAANAALEKLGKPAVEPLQEKVKEPEVIRFVDNGDGTVTDNMTGLMWQKEDDGKQKNYEEALEYCKNLSLGGYSNWRLPRKGELMELAKLGYGTLKQIFPNIKAEIYWAMTTDRDLYWVNEEDFGPVADKIAYTVDFDPESGNYGMDVTYFKYYKYYVRAVRNTRHAEDDELFAGI